ncbi:hypothetical protein [Halomonas elongata]|uniref:Uncharacterized protein n=1 Tax=Halomonas elongata (strain ATCC 33173 / DSM 2581 / NBRC 15536 / NCIMB 2198 / 1H9) TaxID=768066 RepID=A0ABZ0TC21_HALED|nr:hypothetical protein [Halomonas elongata]WBF19796.1 hypothetical protein LM502_08955 [Halomonas elongata]WPU48665.1 hypothetical protein SR933_07180 [Halomonas elongata DSM 2581]
MSKLAVTTFVDLEDATSRHLDEADQVAERALRRLSSPMKRGLHAAKAEEALRTEGPRPLLDAEAAALGESVEVIVARVADQRKKYDAKCAKIESARIKARADIRAAASAAEQKRIVNQLSADLQA